MSDIDWSKAPEGATHFQPGDALANTRPLFWRVVDGKGVEVWAFDSSVEFLRDHFTYSAKGCIAFDASLCIGRPASAWTGTGLPPVGAVCEYYWEAGDSWRSGTCVAHFDERAVICDADDEDCAERLDAHHVRPVRTPEQIAAEEREKGIAEIYAVLNNFTRDLKQDAAALWDLGYRKTEAP